MCSCKVQNKIGLRMCYIVVAQKVFSFLANVFQDSLYRKSQVYRLALSLSQLTEHVKVLNVCQIIMPNHKMPTLYVHPAKSIFELMIFQLLMHCTQAQYRYIRFISLFVFHTRDMYQHRSTCQQTHQHVKLVTCTSNVPSQVSQST